MTENDEPDPYWARLGDSARSLLGDMASPTHHDAVPHDKYDELAWRLARDEAASLDDMVREFGKERDYTEDFFADMFNLAIKGDPQVRPREEMAPTRVPNREMIEYFKKYPEFANLHQYTSGSLYSSAMALLSMQTEIEQAYERMDAARELAEQLEQMREQAQQAAQDALDQALAGLDPDAAQAALDAAQAAAGQVSGLTDQANAAADAAARAGGQALRSAARRATDEADEEAALMSAFGVEDGVLQRMSFAERAALAKRLRSNRLAKFASMIGAFRQMAQAEMRRNVMTAPSEIAGVTLGDDLSRLVASEYTSLASPELEEDFWLRYVERRHLNLLLRGNERQGKGPIIVVCDESQSMEATDIGGASREAWSKGFALALVDAARTQGRDVHYIGFASPRQQWQTELTYGKAGVDKVIEFAEHFFCGGTSYPEPMGQAMALARTYADRGLPRPDIVFITDDEFSTFPDSFVQSWRAAREQISIRCWGVHIGTRVSGALAQVCDDVRSITQYTSDVDAVADIFRAL